MPGVDRFEPNHGGIRELLRSAATQDAVRRRAERIAAAADRGLRQPGHRVTSAIGVNRADAEVAAVSFEARVAQSKNNNLLRAVDAGRG